MLVELFLYQCFNLYAPVCLINEKTVPQIIFYAITSFCSANLKLLVEDYSQMYPQSTNRFKCVQNFEAIVDLYLCFN